MGFVWSMYFVQRAHGVTVGEVAGYEESERLVDHKPGWKLNQARGAHLQYVDNIATFGVNAGVVNARRDAGKSRM